MKKKFGCIKDVQIYIKKGNRNVYGKKSTFQL